MPLRMEGEVVYAIHNFDASVEDEISLEAGEAILVIEKDDLYNDGWWQGKNSRGEIGLFPMNFISTVNPHAGTDVGDRYANLLNNPEGSTQINLDSEEESSSDDDSPPPQKATGGRLSDPPLESNGTRSNSKSSSIPPYKEEPSMLTALTSSSSDSDTSSQADSPLYHPAQPSPLSPTYSSTQPSPLSPKTTHPEQATKRIIAAASPRTPNRSSFRQSVRMSMMDTSELNLPHPSNWTTDQVVEWLNLAGFGSVSNLFQENEITGDILIKLDLNTLKDIGIIAFGKRFNLNNAINGLKLKHNIDTPAQVVPQQPTSPPSPSSEVSGDHPPAGRESHQVEHDLYPLEERETSQLSKKVQALALGRNKSGSVTSDPVPPPSEDPHSHVQQWLQGASDYDYEQDKEESTMMTNILDPSMEIPSEPRPDVFSESASSSLPSQRIMGNDASPYPGSASSSQVYASMLKKQVSFSQHKPEVIGVSNTNTSFDDTMRSKGSDRALPQPPGKGSNGMIIPPPRDGSSLSQMSPRLDLFPNSDVATRTYSVEPVENTPVGAHPPISGWLKKQEGAIKLWKLRWCELEGGYLRVWDSSKRKKMKMAIDLRGYKPVLDPNLNPGKYCFKLVHPNSKSQGFSSDEASDVRLWMKALMKVSIDRDISAPVVTSCTVNTVPLHVARKLAPRPPSAMLAGSREGEQPNPNHNQSNYI